MVREFKSIFVVMMLTISICGGAVMKNAVVVNAYSAFDTTKITVSQKKKVTTKKVKLSSKVKKTKTSKSTNNKSSNSTSYPNKETIVETAVVVTTNVESSWKKGSNIKVVKTTVITKTITKTIKRYKGQIGIDTLAPKTHSSVKNAFKTLGFTIIVDPTSSYAGITSYAKRNITLRYADDDVYHELGHFVSFIADNYCNTSSFINIYNSEKNKYTGSLKSYVTKTSAEYFAESYRDYILHNSTLKSTRPKTYDAISKALAKITPEQVKKIHQENSLIWSAGL